MKLLNRSELRRYFGRGELKLSSMAIDQLESSFMEYLRQVAKITKECGRVTVLQEDIPFIVSNGRPQACGIYGQGAGVNGKSKRV